MTHSAEPAQRSGEAIPTDDHSGTSQISPWSKSELMRRQLREAINCYRGAHTSPGVDFTFCHSDAK